MPTRDSTARAKQLRKRPTDAEHLLWGCLRAKQIGALKFRRQAPIGQYIVDFVCHERGIIIEVDGGQHSIDKERDIKREGWLNKQGYKVLRFWNHEALTNIDEVLNIIREACLKPTLPLPLPSREGKSQGNPR